MMALKYKYCKLLSPCKLPLSFLMCAGKETRCCKSQLSPGQNVKAKFPLALKSSVIKSKKSSAVFFLSFVICLLSPAFHSALTLETNSHL